MNELKAQSHQEFAAWAKSYDRSILQRLLFAPSHQRIIHEIGDVTAARILDIGCGTCRLAQRLADGRPQTRVFAVDLCESMIRAAHGHIAAHDRIHRAVADSEHLPFLAGAFDFVTCSNSFHHYPNQQAALLEMHRVLTPGGRLILTDGFRDNWFGHLIYDLAVPRFEGGRIHHASAEEFRKLFLSAGFRDLRQSTVAFPAPFIVTSAVA
jgi:ubiquinone/menaquinone biosynthesis C-methylase UbiE